MNNFISSKSFDVLVYAIGGVVLLCSEVKKLVIKPFSNK